MIDVGVSPTRFHVGDPVELDISLTNTGTGTCTNVIFTLRLPAGIARLHGRERIEVGRVLPGESKTSRLGIRAEEPGQYRLTSTNFSYRDHRGRSHRESVFDTEITVDPAPVPPSPPQIMVELQDAELPYNEWTIVRGRVTNAGEAGVFNLEIRLSGQVITDQRTARSTLEQLPPGRSVDVPFYVLAQHAGANVPVHLDLAYYYQSRRQVRQTTQSIRVVRDRTITSGAAPAAGRHPVKVLILGANPLDTESLEIGREIREIRGVIRAGRERDNIEVCFPRLAARPDDIIQALLDEEPWLVHFAGHGGGQHQSFAAESEYGLAHVIPVDDLVELFGAFGRNVKCVLVNCCDTELLARELSAVVPYAIGMRQPVHDKSAIRFSHGFYQALAAGNSIDDAFRLGMIQLTMAPIGSDASAPILFRGSQDTSG
jgi:uncharacterized repeat protein (TIGR01451 family)